MDFNSLDTNSAIRGWSVFHDGQVRRFLVIWLEQQISRLALRLETIGEADLKQIQGQIAAFKVLRLLLESSSISGIIEDMKKQ